MCSVSTGRVVTAGSVRVVRQMVQQRLSCPAPGEQQQQQGGLAGRLWAHADRQRQEAAEAAAEAADRCGGAALLWRRLSAQLETASSPPQTADQLPPLRHALAGCRQLRDQLAAGGLVSAPALQQLSERLAAAGGRLDAVSRQLAGGPEQTADLLETLRQQLQPPADSRPTAGQLAAAADTAHQLRQLSVTAATPELRAQAAALLQVRRWTLKNGWDASVWVDYFCSRQYLSSVPWAVCADYSVGPCLRQPSSDPAPGYLQDCESVREAPLWSRYDSAV